MRIDSKVIYILYSGNIWQPSQCKKLQNFLFYKDIIFGNPACVYQLMCLQMVVVLKWLAAHIAIEGVGALYVRGEHVLLEEALGGELLGADRTGVGVGVGFQMILQGIAGGILKMKFSLYWNLCSKVGWKCRCVGSRWSDIQKVPNISDSVS